MNAESLVSFRVKGFCFYFIIVSISVVQSDHLSVQMRICTFDMQRESTKTLFYPTVPATSATLQQPPQCCWIHRPAPLKGSEKVANLYTKMKHNVQYMLIVRETISIYQNNSQYFSKESWVQIVYQNQHTWGLLMLY